MAQPERAAQGCARRGDLRFVNKLRSFKIGFSMGEHFEKLGPTAPPSLRVRGKHVKNARDMERVKLRLWEGNIKGEKRRGQVGNGRSLPIFQPEGLTPHLAIPGPSRALFSFTTILTRIVIDTRMQGSLGFISPSQV